MGNRPKIWVDKDKYIYRCDYNFAKELALRHKETLTDAQLIDRCFKFSHNYGTYKKGDIVKVQFYSHYYSEFFSDSYFEILRVDYQTSSIPKFVLVRPTDGGYAISLRVSGKYDVDKIIGKKEYDGR